MTLDEAAKLDPRIMDKDLSDSDRQRILDAINQQLGQGRAAPAPTVGPGGVIQPPPGQGGAILPPDRPMTATGTLVKQPSSLGQPEALPTGTDLPYALERSRPGLARPGILPTLGELAGSGVASMATGGKGRVLGAILPAAGAAGGLTLETLLLNQRFPTKEELGWEAGATLLPNAVESGVRAGWRGLQKTALARTRPGRVAREALQYEAAQPAGQRIFNAPTHEEVDRLFEQVRAVQGDISTEPIAKALQYYDPRDISTIKAQMRRADLDQAKRTNMATPNRFSELGKRWGDLVQDAKDVERRTRQGLGNTRPPGYSPGGAAGGPIDYPTMNLAEIQDLRSGLRNSLEEMSGPDVRIPDKALVVKRAIDELDNMVLANMTPKGSFSPETVALLEDARKAYQRMMAADELGDLFLKHSRLGPRKGNVRQLQLADLRDDLAKNTSAQAKAVNRNLATIPESAAALENFLTQLEPYSRNFEVVMELGNRDLPASRMGMVHALTRGVAESAISVEGAQRLLETIQAQNGRISPNAVAPILGLLRRDAEERAQQKSQGQPLPLGQP